MADNGMITRDEDMDSIYMEHKRDGFVRYLHMVLRHRS